MFKKRNAEVTKDDLAAYHDECKGLERDYIGEIIKSRLGAWRVASVASLVAIVAVVAAAFAFSRPSPEPLVVLLDKVSGTQQLLTSLREVEITQRNATDMAEVYRYVLDYESYDWHTVQSTYDLTGLKSSPSVARDYAARFEGAEALDVTLGQEWRIVPDIISIDRRSANENGGTAFIRFQTQKVKSDGTRTAPIVFAAEIAFEYGNVPLSVSERYRNYLGFHVTSYRPTRELLTNR